MKYIKKITFRGEEFSVFVGIYPADNKTHFIHLTDENDEPELTATSWIPNVLEGCVAIKNYSENEGILQCLIDNAIISDVLYVDGAHYVCYLL